MRVLKPVDRAAPPTLAQALRHVVHRLRQGGLAQAGDEARRLTAQVIGLTSTELLSKRERRLSREEIAALEKAIARRLAHEPISRIVKAREFWGRSFTLSPATLDPRPDSETVVAAALTLAREEGWLAAPLDILDVGTGSGCLIISLLTELERARGVGTDISPAALATARANAAALGVGERCAFIAADALESLRGKFDIMVSNPPYIPTAEIAGLEPEVRLYDPHLALDGGSDGLDLFRRLAEGVAAVVPDGWVILEVGRAQAEPVAALLSARLGGGPLRTFSDVAGRRRCVATRTRG